MVLILDDNSEIGARVGSDLGYLICLRHLFISGAVINLSLNSLMHMCPTYFELPSE